VYGNRELLEMIIYNLCDNAVKYNKENGKVFVSVYEKNDEVYLKVKDTGQGIPEEDIERIFERFYRVDKSRSRQIGGTGLGLSIVKHACILNNARINVESKIDEGSEFTIIFPKV
ncbi:MAG: ATP-binding protein, partial [Erysipelotrichaceae bacterium]|nr:ATP-binding protein [Erysipelotrichaceae bacterium]